MPLCWKIDENRQVGIPFTHVGTPDSVEGWKALQDIPSLGTGPFSRFKAVRKYILSEPPPACRVCEARRQ
jgi:hypothetical protein